MCFWGDVSGQLWLWWQRDLENNSPESANSEETADREKQKEIERDRDRERDEKEYKQEKQYLALVQSHVVNKKMMKCATIKIPIKRACKTDWYF